MKPNLGKWFGSNRSGHAEECSRLLHLEVFGRSERSAAAAPMDANLTTGETKGANKEFLKARGDGKRRPVTRDTVCSDNENVGRRGESPRGLVGDCLEGDAHIAQMRNGSGVSEKSRQWVQVSLNQTYYGLSCVTVELGLNGQGQTSTSFRGRA